jgi:hypothetical protein
MSAFLDAADYLSTVKGEEPRPAATTAAIDGIEDPAEMWNTLKERWDTTASRAGRINLVTKR